MKTFTAIAALLLLAGPAPAQQPSQERSARFIAALCPRYLTDLNKQPALAAAVQHRALSTEELCSCVEREFVSDAKVREFIDVKDAEVAPAHVKVVVASVMQLSAVFASEPLLC